MTDTNEDRSLEPASVRLARSRAELKALFEPVEGDPAMPPGEPRQRSFPRSWTMKLLTKGAGTGGFAVLAAALFATSPTKAMKLLRLLPMNAITKILVSRLITARGAKK
jgi:hypothetical protein